VSRLLFVVPPLAGHVNRDAAGRILDSFAAAGGAVTAAGHLEKPR
jgi:hypothetical protein